MDSERLLKRKDEFLKIMSDIRQKKKFDTVVLMITDVLLEGSQLLYVGDEDTIHQAFNIKGSENCAFVPKIMSRKKQGHPHALRPVGLIGFRRFLQTRTPGGKAMAFPPGFSHIVCGNQRRRASPRRASSAAMSSGVRSRGAGADGFMALTAFSAGTGGWTEGWRAPSKPQRPGRRRR